MKLNVLVHSLALFANKRCLNVLYPQVIGKLTHVRWVVLWEACMHLLKTCFGRDVNGHDGNVTPTLNGLIFCLYFVKWSLVTKIEWNVFVNEL